MAQVVSGRLLSPVAPVLSPAKHVGLFHSTGKCSFDKRHSTGWVICINRPIVDAMESRKRRYITNSDDKHKISKPRH
jgi:hypothetical protein